MSSVTPEIHETLDRGRVADLASRRSYEQAWRQFAQHKSTEEFCSSWLVIQAHAIGGVSDGVVVLLKPGTNAFAPVAYFPETPRDRGHLAKVSERALQTGRGVLEPHEHAEDADAAPRYQLAYPVRLDGEVRGVVGFELDPRPEPQLQNAMRELQWGSCWLEVLLRRRADPKEAEALRLKLALDVVSTLLEQPSLKESANAFTTELASRFGCDRVTLGLLKGRRVTVTAVSHSPMFESRANLVRAIERAMEESVDQEAVVVYPPEGDEQPVVARAHEALLAESEAGSAATFPLVNGDGIVGALTFERAAGHRFEPPTLEVCEAVASIAGPVVALKQANEASLPVHAARSARGFWDRLFGPGYPGYKLTAIGVIALAIFLALAEGAFRVSADSMVEGVVQRALTAPINGFVKVASLRAGDRVREGQVIAQLDDRELRLERAKLLSQRAQLAQQYREAMGKRERAQVRIVSAQIAQAEAQLALIEEQLGRTTLAAPFDGVIVRGDLSQSLGSPVERGEVLFEVAPLDDYRVVLQVDERDIGHVVEGQRGELTVTSMPGERFALQIRRITPVNTAKDGRNLFRVEAVLESGAGSRLRPGMEGVGKIEIEQRKLVWIWTHGLTDWVRLKLWSWLP